MFQVGGDYWKRWNNNMKPAIVNNQVKTHPQTCRRGSWDPTGAWCSTGGRVYATALGVLSLETYYRYALVSR